jgi:hypothetical protein
MPTLIVPCPHCTQRAQLDSDLLPDRPAYFPCPHCKQKVVVDKRVLLAEQAAAATPATTPVDQRGPVPLPQTTDTDRRISRLPADAQFPSGIIVGEDQAVMDQIRAKFASVGSDVEPVDSVNSARSIILNENPDLCIFVAAGQMTPPHEPMKPLCDLPETIRRRLYLALVADGLKTLDGTAAFMFQVNMVLGKQDLDHFEAALYSGIEYHRRLYRPYLQAVESKLAI